MSSPVLNPTDTLHERILNAVAIEIQSLPLTGPSPPGSIPASQVYAQNVPDPRAIVFPCVVCTVDGVQEEELDGNFEQIEVAYPVRVYIMDHGSPVEQVSNAASRKTYLAWRRLIAKHFRVIARMLGVPECYNCRAKEGIVLDSELLTRPAYQFVVSGLTIWCDTSEPRIP